MQDALANPVFRFLVTLLSGRIVAALLDTPTGQRFIDSISGAEDREDHRAVVGDYAGLVTNVALNLALRPPEAERTPTEPMIKNGRVNWQRVLEVTAELLLVLGPLLKLMADYSRSRQGVKPDQARG
jgi:hypothetical protein